MSNYNTHALEPTVSESGRPDSLPVDSIKEIDYEDQTAVSIPILETYPQVFNGNQVDRRLAYNAQRENCWGPYFQSPCRRSYIPVPCQHRSAVELAAMPFPEGIPVRSFNDDQTYLPWLLRLEMAGVN